MNQSTTNGIQSSLLTIGDIQEEKGKVVRGRLHLIDLPNGDEVKISVIIASGKLPGKTLLITANIHGDEVTGVVVVHRLLESLNLEELKGRIVFIPSLNPTGLINGTRYPQFEKKDPNRAWPEYKPKHLVEQEEDTQDYLYSIQKRMDDHQNSIEIAFEPIAKIFESIRPDYHCDLHTFSTLSIPFIFLDRVLYDKDEEAAEAKELFNRASDMVKALGLTMVVERSARIYVKDKLHRSTSGYTLNCLRIPSCTIEMGPMNDVLPTARDATLTALKNLMIWSEMLTGSVSPITQIPILHFDKPYRYMEYPQAPETGIVDYLKAAGESFQKGEAIAIIRHIDGTRKAVIESEMSGYVIGWYTGVAVYKGNLLGMVAVEDKDGVETVKWSSLPKSALK